MTITLPLLPVMAGLYRHGEPWRCCACHRILARLWLVPGSTIELKCRCGAWNTLTIDITPTTP